MLRFKRTVYTSATPTTAGDTPIGTLSWTLSGDDAAAFSIDANGVVSMVSRDFEAPEDTDTNNVYSATVTVTDSDGNADTQDIAITVTDVVESATFTISGLVDAEIQENIPYTSATPTTAGDTPIGTLSWTLSGDDAAAFSIDANGVVSMVSRDYEAPEDTDTNNIYLATVTVTDSDGNADTQDIAITVTDVAESATFTISGLMDTDTVAENAVYTSATPTTAGDTPIGTLSWTLSGDDAAAFSIDANGVVSMVARDFEAPEDTGADNVYSATVTATDSDGNADTQDIAITVTDVVESATFTISGLMDTDTVAENTPYTSATPTTAGDTPIGTLSWTLSGDDAAAFSIDANGVVSMVSRDYEAPEDTDTNNIYLATVTATDRDGNADTQDIAITVTNVAESATFTISGLMDADTVAENTPYTSATPTTAGDTPVGALSWTLSGDDAAAFSIDANGVVSMVSRDFEAPEDTGADNVYSATVTATDRDGNADTQDIAITVTNVVESATFTISGLMDADGCREHPLHIGYTDHRR